MTINHIASGSKGNCIMIDDGHTKLLLDAGLSMKKTLQNVKMSGVSGVFVTHEHNDHCKGVPYLLHRGYKVFMSRGTQKAGGFTGGVIVGHDQVVSVGSFQVKCLNVVHDAAEPLCFVFVSDFGKTVIYMADCGSIPYSFTGITHWIIECNFSLPQLENSKNIHDKLKTRIFKYHLSLEKLMDFFSDPLMTEKTEEIHLVHLSESNSDGVEFTDKLQSITGVPVYTKN